MCTASTPLSMPQPTALAAELQHISESCFLHGHAWLCELLHCVWLQVASMPFWETLPCFAGRDTGVESLKGLITAG